MTREQFLKKLTSTFEAPKWVVAIREEDNFLSICVMNFSNGFMISVLFDEEEKDEPMESAIYKIVTIGAPSVCDLAKLIRLAGVDDEL